LDQFRIEMKNLEVDSTTEDSCEFTVSGNILSQKETISVPTELPLVCTINPIDDPGTLTATYDYIYKFIKKETITISEKTF